jgi:multimeric flavodoxin WrbA
LKILALIGSPRKRSNTDILVDEVLRGAETKGHTWEKVYLYDLEIKPCLDCRACKKGNYTCPMDDGMKGSIPRSKPQISSSLEPPSTGTALLER